MPDIFHTFPISAAPEKIFKGISSPQGLDTWWTKTSTGDAQIGLTYELDFGPGYIWKAIVTKCIPDKEFEWEMTEADKDWIENKIGFSLVPKDTYTEVNFYHIGWAENSEHYRISSFCWAMYLRILKRYLEFGEIVPYEKRLSV